MFWMHCKAHNFLFSNLFLKFLFSNSTASYNCLNEISFFFWDRKKSGVIWDIALNSFFCLVQCVFLKNQDSHPNLNWISFSMVWKVYQKNLFKVPKILKNFLCCKNLIFSYTGYWELLPLLCFKPVPSSPALTVPSSPASALLTFQWITSKLW